MINEKYLQISIFCENCDSFCVTFDYRNILASVDFWISRFKIFEFYAVFLKEALDELVAVAHFVRQKSENQLKSAYFYMFFANKKILRHFFENPRWTKLLFCWLKG